ncbi:MAG: type I-E CRISPR-associated protein Cse1/CasA [Deltaproteobacteria bacterium]|nr:type I-E CRISPR-associated protein Cse1/CasA [Deltaproteobacteria bacterium]
MLLRFGSSREHKSCYRPLLPYDPERDKPIAASGTTDLCAWEQPQLPTTLPLSKEPSNRPTGYLDMLTWLSRRVELVVTDNVITGYINAVGKGLAEGSPEDPMSAYRADKDRGWVAIDINPERAFWRSSEALFQSVRDESGRFKRPMACDLVASPEALEALPPHMSFSVEIFGLASNQAKIEALRTESVGVFAKTLNDPDVRSVVTSSLERANEGVQALWVSLRMYARHVLSAGSREPDKQDVSNFVNSTNAQPAAWSALGVSFEQLLRELATDPDAAEVTFAKAVRTVVEDGFTQATQRCDASGAGLKARAIAERWLRTNYLSLSLQDTSPSPQPAELTP